MKINSNNLDYLKPEITNIFTEQLEIKSSKKFFREIKGYHPSVIASYLQILNDVHRKKLIKTISIDLDSRILVELEPNFLKKIIKEFNHKILCKAIEELDSDDAASIISILDYSQKYEILSKISIRNRLSIENNLSYQNNSAGRLMQSEIVKIPSSFNVEQVIDYLRKKKKLPKVFYDLFVIDNEQRLEGTIPLSTIITSKRNVAISEIINKSQNYVESEVDQEEVADIFRKRNLTSLAVVDKSKKPIGVINIEDAVDVIDIEAEEDILKLAGVGEQSFYGAVLSVTRARMAWLFFNLIAAFLAVFIIKNFESTIEKFALLAALMPVIASMGGCSGTQALTTAVRAIAMKKLTWSNALRSTGKEVLVGLLNGLIFSLFAFIFTLLWFDDIGLSYVISFSLLLNLVFGSFFGAFIPIMLTRLGIDPAFASGTFVITFTDILGFFIFLYLASIYLI